MLFRIKLLAAFAALHLGSYAVIMPATAFSAAGGAAVTGAVVPVYFCNELGKVFTIYELSMLGGGGHWIDKFSIDCYLAGYVVSGEKNPDSMNLVAGANHVLHFDLTTATGCSLALKVKNEEGWVLPEPVVYKFAGNEKLVVVTVQAGREPVRLECFVDEAAAARRMAVLSSAAADAKRRSVRDAIAAYAGTDDDSDDMEQILRSVRK